MKHHCYCLLFISLIACHGRPQPLTSAEKQRDNEAMLKEALTFIKSGDIILRTGKDFTSDRIRELSRIDNTYSHGGVAFVDSSGVHIYNIVPKEKDNPEEMRVDDIATFCGPAKNKGFGIARFSLSSKEIDSLKSYFQWHLSNKTKFDLYFDIHNDSAMYCSEMIKKGIEKATSGRIIIQPDTIKNKITIVAMSKFFRLPKERFYNLAVIPIDKIYTHPACTIVKEYVFEE